MGRRGPSPTPTESLKRRGSWRARKNRQEGQTETPFREPEAPKWLDAKARNIWRRVTRLLLDQGTLAEIDGMLLARYCRLFVRWRDLDEFIQNEGETYQTWNGAGDLSMVRVFPQVKLCNELSTLLLRIEQEFGMSPSARTRIKAEQPDRELEEREEKRKLLRIG